MNLQISAFRPIKSVHRTFQIGVNLLLCAFVVTAFAGRSAMAQEMPEAPAAAKPEMDHGASQASHRPSNSDEIAYWYGSLYRTPFVLQPNSAKAANIVRNSIEYKHAGFWSLGSNFADLTVSQSNIAEPASGGGSGATEVYVILRSTLGLNEATGTKNFKRGPLRDLAIEAGANLETKNSSFAPAERTLYLGPNLQFAVPRGYFNVGLHLRKEWNHEGVLGKSEDYSPDFNIEPTWMFPFPIGKLHLGYNGVAEYNTQKGNDSFGSKTVGEFMFRNAVTVDIGSLLFKRAQLVELSGGFWYWHNEYGKTSADPGAEQKTPMIGVVIHLDGGRATRHQK